MLEGPVGLKAQGPQLRNVGEEPRRCDGLARPTPARMLAPGSHPSAPPILSGLRLLLSAPHAPTPPVPRPLRRSSGPRCPSRSPPGRPALTRPAWPPRSAGAAGRSPPPLVPTAPRPTPSFSLLRPQVMRPPAPCQPPFVLSSAHSWTRTASAGVARLGSGGTSGACFAASPCSLVAHFTRATPRLARLDAALGGAYVYTLRNAAGLCVSLVPDALAPPAAPGAPPPSRLAMALCDASAADQAFTVFRSPRPASAG
jgi:hypothetical protein